MPLKLVKKSFESHSKFQCNVLFNISCINEFPFFYRDIFCNWKKYFQTNPETPSCILSQCSWFNKFIIVDNSCVISTNPSAFFFNWDSLHVRLNTHCKAWSYKKKKHNKIKAHRKPLQKEPRVKRCLLILDLKIIGKRKAFYRQEIPESSCVRKVTVDIDIFVTSRNGERKIMQSIRIRLDLPRKKESGTI